MENVGKYTAYHTWMLWDQAYLRIFHGFFWLNRGAAWTAPAPFVALGTCRRGKEVMVMFSICNRLAQ